MDYPTVAGLVIVVYRADTQTHTQTDTDKRLKPGFHYPS